MINNSVTNWRGDVIGFRCTQCSSFYERGWGDICNNCRKKHSDNKTLLNEIKKLRKELGEVQKR